MGGLFGRLSTRVLVASLQKERGLQAFGSTALAALFAAGVNL
jgi:hypothetical protein